MKQILLCSLASLLLLSSCNTVKKSYRNGDYETTIAKTVNKLKSNKQDDDNIIYLEAAYDKLYLQSTNRITYLKKEGQPQNVVEIYNLMLDLRNNQLLIQPLLPLHIESKNRDAQFHFVSDDDLIASKNKAADYLYAKAKQLLSNNNRQDARDAYDLLLHLQNMYPGFRDASSLTNEALQKGTNQVFVQIVNESNANLYSELEKELTTLPTGDLNAQWVNFYTTTSNISPDYKVKVSMQQINVTPDLLAPPVIHTETKSVQDGWNYQLDAHGNVMKDSSGNDIKTPKYVTIKCMVSEFMQQKTATIAGTIDFTDARTNSLLYSYPFNTTKVFQNAYAIANGDLNALSEESLNKIKNMPVPYPTEIDLLLQAGTDLKYEMTDIIKGHIGLLEQ